MNIKFVRELNLRRQQREKWKLAGRNEAYKEMQEQIKAMETNHKSVIEDKDNLLKETIQGYQEKLDILEFDKNKELTDLEALKEREKINEIDAITQKYEKDVSELDKTFNNKLNRLIKRYTTIKKDLIKGVTSVQNLASTWNDRINEVGSMSSELDSTGKQMKRFTEDTMRRLAEAIAEIDNVDNHAKDIASMSKEIRNKSLEEVMHMEKLMDIFEKFEDTLKDELDSLKKDKKQILSQNTKELIN